jgi:uncharacterized protein (DUF2249 family)
LKRFKAPGRARTYRWALRTEGLNMTTDTIDTPPATTCIDVRSVPPPQRHPLIFSTFDALTPGQAFEIVNDHDPVPLYFQFEKTRLGQFDWRYLESGPQRWHVRISRVAAGMPAGSSSGCCGACSCK